MLKHSSDASRGVRAAAESLGVLLRRRCRSEGVTVARAARDALVIGDRRVA